MAKFKINIELTIEAKSKNKAVYKAHKLLNLYHNSLRWKGKSVIAVPTDPMVFMDTYGSPATSYFGKYRITNVEIPKDFI